MNSEMRMIVIFLLFLACSTNKSDKNLSSPFEFEELADLPNDLKESSGIELAESDHFWSFNDSGGKPELYKFDREGQLKQIVRVNNALNIDWEDMTKDEEGNIYIGDFGNNNNDRKDLVIYKISRSKIESAEISSVMAEKIEFRLSDQHDFPPAKQDRLFDIESLFASGNYLYMLTKDRSKPFMGKSKLYRLGKHPGKHIAEYRDLLVTDKDKSKGQITAADLSNDGSTLVLLAKDMIWLFERFQEDQFFERKPLQIDLPAEQSMEGVVLESNRVMYLTSEGSRKKAGRLFRLELSLVYQ